MATKVVDFCTVFSCSSLSEGVLCVWPLSQRRARFFRLLFSIPAANETSRTQWIWQLFPIFPGFRTQISGVSETSNGYFWGENTLYILFIPTYTTLVGTTTHHHTWHYKFRERFLLGNSEMKCALFFGILITIIKQATHARKKCSLSFDRYLTRYASLTFVVLIVRFFSLFKVSFRTEVALQTNLCI